MTRRVKGEKKNTLIFIVFFIFPQTFSLSECFCDLKWTLAEVRSAESAAGVPSARPGEDRCRHGGLLCNTIPTASAPPLKAQPVWQLHPFTTRTEHGHFGPDSEPGRPFLKNI